MPEPLPALNDDFWDETASATLHPQTVLRRIRQELSEGRPHPITVHEAFEIAQTELGYDPNLCIFGEGEIAGPLWVIGAVWGFKKYGIRLTAAKSFGVFLGNATGGDVPYSASGDALTRQAGEMLTRRLGDKLRLNGAETGRFLDELIACFQKVK